MNQNKTVTINGQQYDAHTGLPVAKPAAATPVTKKPAHAAAVHTSTQKSQTLVRRATKKPTAQAPRQSRSTGRSMDIARSSSVSRFAPHPVVAAKKPASAPDIAPTRHPIVTKAAAVRPSTPVVARKSSRDVKEDAIAVALAAPPIKQAKKSFFSRHPRALSIVTLSVVIAIAGSYLTYVNLPSLSVKVAAAQAGIDASFPDYRPDGYSIDGPVTFSDGQVSIQFKANTGTSAFVIKQSQSSWDSSAVLDNIVREKVGEKYITSQERGLTIYTYNGNAAWVNAGILYTIEGDAPLSGEQIRRIATSL